jgi:DHA1 family bicyclomycin/chloramphenicol resistance-like MFS transporter
VGSPFALREEYGLSAHQFALLFAVNGFGLVAGAQVNASLVKRMAPIRILRVALPTVLVLALLLWLVVATDTGGLAGLLVVLFLLLSIVNFIAPNASALALGRHGEMAGTAAAFIGSLQAGVAGGISPLVGVLGGDAVAMAVVMAGSTALAFVVLVVATPAYRRGGWHMAA